MDDFSTVCLTTEAKINLFIKMNKLDEKIDLLKVLECIGEYKTMDGNQSKSLPNIKEEIEIDINELKPNIGRFVINCLFITKVSENYDDYIKFIIFRLFYHLHICSLCCLIASL